ncbi:ABC transporter permease subunit, partial [Shouchella clausii]|uniref:ABC transporter permease subunit n=2 Tax=Bacillaceae TaxID=186817 RepID=UPI000BD2771C
MVGLIRNEIDKFLLNKQNSLFIIFLLLVLVTITVLQSNTLSEDANWREELENRVSENKEVINDTSIDTSIREAVMNENITLNYALENNINLTNLSMWQITNSYLPIVMLIAFFIIFIASGMFFDEISNKTINNLVLSPISKKQIILSKILFLILLVFSLMLATFTASLLSGIIISDSYNFNITTLELINGEIVEQNLAISLISTYVLHTVELIIIALLSFLMTIILNNRSLSIIIMISVVLFGERINLPLWDNYVIFSNLNLVQYLNSLDYKLVFQNLLRPLTVISIYIIIFHLISIV